jgi:rhodanese-related sulfurtransferase
MSVYKEVDPTTVFDVYKESGGISLIDVREEDEYAACCTTISVNIPLSELKASNGQSRLPRDKHAPLYLICRSGRRSATACELLAGEGYRNLINVRGGMEAWKKLGLPISGSDT